MKKAQNDNNCNGIVNSFIQDRTRVEKRKTLCQDGGLLNTLHPLAHVRNFQFVPNMYDSSGSLSVLDEKKVAKRQYCQE